jgi:hypothetical protein
MTEREHDAKKRLPPEIYELALAAAWPLAARVQQKVARVGIVTLAANSDALMMRVLRDSFRDLGYIGGQSISLEFAFADGDLSRVPALAADLARKQVDVIVVDGGSLNGAVRAAISTIPIVFCHAHQPGRIRLCHVAGAPRRKPHRLCPYGGGNQRQATRNSQKRLSELAQGRSALEQGRSSTLY